jgi:hypothetical protein
VVFRITVYYVPIWCVPLFRYAFLPQNRSLHRARLSIFVAMVLYSLVGVEIIKRRRRVKIAASDTITLDHTILPDTHVAVQSSEASPVTANVELGAVSHLRHGWTSYSSDKPLLRTANLPSSATPYLRAPRQPALSFRHYILMPLFCFLALLTVWVAPTTNRVAHFVDPSFQSFPLLLVVGITGSLRGFWNGIVFLTIGMKSWKRRRVLETVSVRRV